MNKNKKYLAVFGIFALVIVTTAVSFAFFTYSRLGQTTTTITSGDIEFSFIEGASASLANAFPVSDSVGAQDTTEEYTFTVNMKSSSTSNKMNYNVYLLDANDQESVNYFNNEQIKFALVKNGTYVAGTSSSLGVKLSEIAGFTAGSYEGEGPVLENQEIAANTTDEYKLRIWISDDVNYSNTDKTDDGTNEENDDNILAGKYNSYKYSLKVKVTSGMTSSIGINLSSSGREITVDLEDNNGLSAYAVTKSSSSPNESDWIEITDETANKKITSKTISYIVEENGIYYVHVKNKLNQTKHKSINVNPYVDSSGAAYPILKKDLVPVVIANTGTVTKTNLNERWYDYDESIWANAVILTDDAPTYNNGDMILEEHIESYFVWIPRYRYKIFDEGKYTSLTSKENAEQPIEIEFETKATPASTGTSFDTWLTHPAFTSFDTDGFWVGKFESGYRGATSTGEAQQDVANSSKLIIKPNVYSWRNITVGNAFKTSYDYNRNLDSHMMKNTEWGAVAYLSHSKYGNVGSLRTNNNRSYLTGYSSTEEPTTGYNSNLDSISGNRNEETAPGNDGTYTVNYFNSLSNISSTTGNYSGIYDMAGGAHEYVMGYTTGSSIGIGGESYITSLYPTFFNTGSIYTKYYDRYTSTVTDNYNNRILGDATGEMGPFYSGVIPAGSVLYYSSWYKDVSGFVSEDSPWFCRGSSWYEGSGAGVFAFVPDTGIVRTDISFRVVLTSSK